LNTKRRAIKRLGLGRSNEKRHSVTAALQLNTEITADRARPDH
jgi:hypothetical protein